MPKATNKKTTKKPSAAQLEKRVAELEKELAVAESTSTKKNVSEKPLNWRTPVVALMVVLFCLLLPLAATAFAVNRTITNTDTYMRSVGPIIKQPAVQAAIVKESQTAIEQQVDVQKVVGDALPPKAQFLAGPIASQVNGAIKNFLQKVVASSQFYNVWLTVNRNTQQATITLIKNNNGNASISVNQLYQYMSQEFQGTPLAALGNKTIPPKVGSITIIKSKWLPTAHRALAALTWLQYIALLAAVLCAGIALYLSRKAKKTGVILALGTAFVLALMLVSTKNSAPIVFHSIHDQTYQAAAVAIWNTVLTPFVSYLTVLITLCLLAAIVTWAGTDARAATWLRKQLHAGFGWLHQVIFRKYAKNEFFSVANRYQSYAYWLIIAVSVALFLFVFRPLTVSIVLTTTLVALILSAVVAVVATPSAANRK